MLFFCVFVGAEWSSTHIVLWFFFLFFLFVCLSSFCVPNVASSSGLSIIDCPSGTI